MRLSQLLKQSLLYYWRSNLAVVLGVATAVAVLAGALLVGDSVRKSLSDLVLQRLGQTSYVVNSNGFVREQMAADIQSDPAFTNNGFASVCPLISIEGTVTHEPSKRLGSGIRVYGVDERFWQFNQQERTSFPQAGKAFISQTLASELGSAVGDSLVLQIQKPSAIPLESLHSKKEDLGQTVRLTVGEVLAADQLGEFSIQPQQAGVRAIFVSLKVLQLELEQPDRVNLLLVSETGSGDSAIDKRAALEPIIRQHIELVDLGIELRSLTQDERPAIALEHVSKVIAQPLANVADETAKSLSLRPSPVFSYLANSIASSSGSIPYSLVTAVGQQDFNSLLQSGGNSTQKSGLPPIVLNEWAASDLGVHSGDQINLSYYLWLEGGHLETKTASFQLAGIVPIRGLAADRNLVPDYPGITGSENLADWDPPFPIDLKRIRQKDEDYWHEYRTTPKAFLQLEDGQKLWQTRFGKITSIRFQPTDPNNNSLGSFAEKLKSSINPALMGVMVVPARAQGLEASRGATDFGEYFLYFSFFLVVSALLLTTLFFKLGVEQRVREIGVLRAIGFEPAKIRKLFLGEGAMLAFVGSLIGLVGAIGYGQLMMFGLRTWWVDAVGTTALRLHVTPLSLLLGGLGGVVAALVCIGLTLRSLGKQSTRSLLSGTIASAITGLKKSKGLLRFATSLRVAVMLTLFGLTLLVAAGFHLIGQVPGFFGGGTLLLAALLFYQSSWLRRRQKTSLYGTGWWPIARLGFRNTTYRPARSILCIALIASAAFIIVAVDSFRHRSGTEVGERKSSTGGYPLFAESLLPLVNDPNSKDGQEALNLTTDTSDSSLQGVTFARFRVQPGDDASCLNLYRPTNPKILAPTNDFLDSNRFVFQSSLANTPDELANPWQLLHKKFPDNAIPVIADANSLTYVLHLKLGDDLIIQPGDQPVRLRIVGALSDSLFQSELLMSEPNFTRLFPEQPGFRFFLIEAPNADVAGVSAKLEERLSDFGFDVQSTSERLANFHRVENTYLSTFQMLGGLGLILGTIGLSAVLLRNILERRRELALMRAVGYNSRHFTLMIIAENAVLLLSGVLTGAICALLAITPVLFTRHGNLFNISLGVLLLAVLMTGLAASVIATWATLRTPLLSALKAE